MIIVSIQFFLCCIEKGSRSGWVYFGINLLNRANQGPFIRSSGTIPIHALMKHGVRFLLRGKSSTLHIISSECKCKFTLIFFLTELLMKVKKNSTGAFACRYLIVSVESGRHSERRLDVEMGGKVCNRHLRE